MTIRLGLSAYVTSRYGYIEVAGCPCKESPAGKVACPESGVNVKSVTAQQPTRVETMVTLRLVVKKAGNATRIMLITTLS